MHIDPCEEHPRGSGLWDSRTEDPPISVMSRAGMLPGAVPEQAALPRPFRSSRGAVSIQQKKAVSIEGVVLARLLGAGRCRRRLVLHGRRRHRGKGQASRRHRFRGRLPIRQELLLGRVRGPAPRGHAVSPALPRGRTVEACSPSEIQQPSQDEPPHRENSSSPWRVLGGPARRRVPDIHQTFVSK